MQMQVDFDFMLEKAKHWEHVDGTLWWRNPQSQQIEPYHADVSAESVEEKPENTPVEVYAPGKNKGKVSTTAIRWQSGESPYFEAFSHSRKSYDDFTDGVNGTLLLQFEGCAGVYKPMDYERPAKELRVTIDSDSLKQGFREVLSYKVSELMGLDIVPPTTMRVQTVSNIWNANKEEFAKEEPRAGSLQLFVTGMKASHVMDDLVRMYSKGEMSEKFRLEFLKLQLLDVVTCNTDRHGSNFMVDVPNEKVYGIDNGLSFPFDTREKRANPGLTALSFRATEDGREHGNYEKMTSIEGMLFPRDLREKILSITQEQFMSLFEDIPFKYGEADQAYGRLQDIQYAFSEANKQEGALADRHIKNSVEDEVKRLKQEAADEAAGELFPDATDVRHARIDEMRGQIKDKLYPKRKRK